VIAAGRGGARGAWLPLACLLASAPVQAQQEVEPWTLERALAHALEHNPDVRIARERVAAARATIEQADAALRPLLQLQSSYVRTNNPMQVFGAVLNQREYSTALDFNDVPDLDNLNVRGILTLPLYGGGGLAAGREAAAAEVAAAELHAQAVRDAFAFETARTFHVVLTTREMIGAAEAGVRSFETAREIALARVETGTALETELLDVEVRLAQAREDLVRAGNASALAVRALANLLGIEGGLVVAEDVPSVAPPPQDAVSVRPELEAVREAQRSAEARVREARSGQRPRVNAFGALDHDRGWVTDGDGTSYTAGVTADWDLWDGKRTTGRVAEATSQLTAAREEERRLRLAFELETERARLGLDEAERRLAVTAASIALAEKSVEITRARFEQGLALASQLIDAETALTVARVRRAEAQGDRRIAIAALRRALGLPQVDVVR
jgi:outer membrane protein TolC